MLPLALLAALAPAAPVPRLPPPNPSGYAYVGVRVAATAVAADSLVIDEPDPGTPAARAGLTAGDVIVSIGLLEKVDNFDQFAEYVLDRRPGTRTRVVVERGGKRVEVWLVLGERPADYGPSTFPNRSRYTQEKK